MKSISRILILILVSMMLLTSCETDDKKEENKGTVSAIATVTATALSTEAPTATVTTEPAKTPDTEPTKSPVITEEATATTKPTKNPSIIVQPTDNPTEKPTIKPTSTSKPTVAPTNKSTATVKPTTPVPTATPTPIATAKPTPTLDPSVDYSQWGKHGFENLLPIPLPFSDEEADWISREDSSDNYQVKNNKKIRLENPDDFIKIFKEYVESFEDYGYMITCEQYEFAAQFKREQLFVFQCGDGYINILIYYRS